MPKRKKLLVDPAVQGSLLRRVTFHWALFFTGLFSTHVVDQLLLTSLVSPKFLKSGSVFFSVFNAALLNLLQ